MENFILIFLLLFLGLFLGHTKIFPKDSAQSLNLFVIYISLPALVLINIPRLTFTSEVLIPLIMPWVLLLISATLIIVFSRVFNWSRKLTGGVLLIVPLGNTSFLGIPMVKAYFGIDHIPYAILYDQFGSFLALSTYGSVILAFFSGSKRPEILDIIKRVILFPPFIALMAALVLKNFTYPELITKVLEMAALTLVPVAMFAVGLQITLKLSSFRIAPISISLGIKLIAAPLIALLLCRLFGFNSEAAKVSVFEAGMGPMITASALAIVADFESELMASITGLGLVLSFLTLPVLFQFL